MSFSHFLLQLPPLVLLLLLMLVFAFIGVITTYFYRKYTIRKERKSAYEKAGDYFALLGGIYGLLLGFVVVLSWGAYNDTQTNASKEESLARSLYREIKYFPDSVEAAPLRKAYLAYVHATIEQEYPQMEAMQPFTQKNRVYFNEVYRQLELLTIKDPRAEKMVAHLNDLALYRSLRQLGAFAEIPMDIWIPLLLGYIILIICSLFIDLESVRMHILANGLLGAFIGLIVYIIILVNHPFAGSLKIEPEEFKLILQMESEDR